MLALLPSHFFFSFLFYTDAGSTFFILLTYYFLVRARRRSSQNWLPFGVALVCASYVTILFCPPFSFYYLRVVLFMYLFWKSGAISVAFRQTNAVWLLFLAGCEIVRDVEYSFAYKRHENGQDRWVSTLYCFSIASSVSTLAGAPDLTSSADNYTGRRRQRKLYQKVAPKPHASLAMEEEGDVVPQIPSSASLSTHDFFRALFRFVATAGRPPFRYFSAVTLALLWNVGVFCIVVFVNGSIVLGS